MKAKRRSLLVFVLSLLIAASLLLHPAVEIAVLSAQGASVVFRRNIGENLIATFYSDGDITISGSGDMYDFTGPHEGAENLSNPTPFDRHVKTIRIDANITNIGKYAFAGCESLSGFSIPASVKSIGSSAFRDCSSLTSVTIPNGVTAIGYSAFENCSNLVSVTIPNSVTEVGIRAFKNCTALTSVTLSESLTSIGGNMFYGCAALSRVTIPEGVTNIYADAFSRCSALAEITFPESLTNIGEGAFYFTPWYDAQPDGLIMAANVAWRYKGNEPRNAVIEVPEGTKTIADFAFARHKGLAEVKIPDSVTHIGTSAFMECDGLKRIVIPNSVTSFGRDLFRDCKNLTEVTLSDKLQSIGMYMFAGCTELTGITIPDSVNSILSSAFEDCTELQNVTIPEGVTTIGIEAFKNCKSFTEITIPESVTEIGAGAFEDCSRLRTFTFPQGVTEVSGAVFENCNALNSVTIPEGVTVIEPQAFRWCGSLKEITIPGSVTSIGYEAFQCAGLEHIEIPGSVTTIGSEAFSHCSSLTSITLGEGVTTIGEYAFSNCGKLTEVTIPASVTAIGQFAFNNYTAQLSDVYYTGSKAQWKSINGHPFNYSVSVVHYHSGSEHTWDTGEVTTPATCTADGEMTYTCIACEETKTEVIKATGHKEGTVPEVAATCIETGLTEGVRCSVCGTVLTGQELIPAIGHSFGAWEPLDAENHQRICQNDATHTETDAHAWNDGKETKVPTYREEGEKTFTCTVCGAEKTEAIAKVALPELKTESIIQVGNTVATLQKQRAETLLAASGEGSVLTKPDSSEVKENELVGSGMTLTRPDGSMLTVIIMGDNDGDGKIAAEDARLALRASVGLEPDFAEWQTNASLVGGAEKVSSAEARLILRASVGLENAAAWLPKEAA